MYLFSPGTIGLVVELLLLLPQFIQPRRKSFAWWPHTSLFPFLGAARSNPWVSLVRTTCYMGIGSTWGFCCSASIRQAHSAPHPGICWAWESPVQTCCRLLFRAGVAGTGEELHSGAHMENHCLFHLRLVYYKQHMWSSEQVSGTRHKSQLMELMLLFWIWNF